MNEITSRWTGGPYYLTPEQRRWTREMFQRKAKRKGRERTMRSINAENCEGCELYEYNLDLEEENENLAEKNRELVQILKEERAMRLINAEALAYEILSEYGADGGTEDVNTIYGMVINAPTIDAEPRKHGEWECPQNKEYCIRADFKALVCNICGCNIPKIAQFPKNYCPNCGADMRKKGGENHETD